MRANPFHVEDILLGLVNLGAPAAIGGGIDPNGAPDIGLGLLMTLAVAGAAVSVGLRPADQPPVRAGTVEAPRIALVGPLLGGLFFVGSLAGERLGMADGSAIGLAAVLAAGLATVLNDRLPVVRPAVRRALVLPFVLVGAGLFSAFASEILGGLDLPAMIREAPAVGSGFAIFVSVLLLGGIAAFYAMFVAAPRQLADPGGSRLAWIPRFALFVVTALLGLGTVLL